MDLQKTDRLYGDAASSLFARRDTMARDDAGRSEAFRNFLKGAEARRADERQSERQSTGRRDDATAAGRAPARDDRTDSRAAAKTGNTDETRAASAKRAQPAEPVQVADAAILAQGQIQENVATSAAKAAPKAASAPDVANTADLPDLPETVPAPIAVSAAPVEIPVEAPAEAVVEAAPAMPVVQAPPAAADPAGQKKTKTAGAATQASAATGKTVKSDATAKAGDPAGANAAVDAVPGDGLKQIVETAAQTATQTATQVTDQMTAQNAAVPTTVEGEAKPQPTEAPSAEARPAGTPPVQSQPSEQGVPAQAQNGAATAASNTAAAAAPAMTIGQPGVPTEPGLESLAADAGRGARSAGEPAAPAASGQGAGAAASAAAAASGGAQANAGGGGNGQGNGQSTGQNAAAQQPQLAAGADQSGLPRVATNDSFTTLLARAQGEASGIDPLAAGTARPGEGAVVTPGASASPGAQATAAAAAAQASAPSVPRPPMPVSNQVAIQLHNAAKDDVRRVTIHLRPEAMGKVEVSMEVDQAGRLQAVISADKAEALDWLRRDAHHLERALQDAGMKMDQQSLSFNLRGDGQSGEGSDGKGSGGRGGVLGQGDELVEAPADGIVRRLDALVDVSV